MAVSMRTLSKPRWLMFGMVVAVACALMASRAECEDGLAPGFKLKSQKIELPVEKQTFGTGPEADAANAHCLTCHSRGMIDTQPPMPLAVWKAEINKMRSAFGCSAPEELVDSLSKFFEHLNNQPATRQEARAAHR